MALATDSNLSLSRKKKGEDIDGSVGGKLTKTETLLESCLDQPVETRHEVVNHTTISPLPGKNYDADTTEPISSGLVTLEELLSWQREANPFDLATVPLANREPPLADCPQRTLVSHDMMGGYLEDRFIQGTDSEAPYAFYHWQYIDIFNYFSHKLVTIPPAVWTNAAHKHGVIVLGTFITEWKEGSTVCEDILKEEESYRSVADKLVQVSHCHGFDGWLINIENPLSKVAVKNTPLFLRYLTDQMHERVPGSLVVWYDSVLENGKLLWQNELNENNRVFFNACDGLFTNYNWTAQSLEAMQAYSGAEGRQADIYVGVDVFARGEVVGGQLETNKALSIIREHNFSAAIFAPGWVYESLVDKTEFCKNQDNFWALLSGYLHVHRPVSTLPFISSFCQGFGKALYWRGQEVVKRSWFHLSAQELQPLYYSHQLEGQGWMKSRGCHDDAWHGGSSLLLEGVLPASLNKICARVFSLHIPLASDILVGLIYKPSAGITVSLELKTTDASLCTHKGVRGLATTSVSPQPLPDSHTLMTHMSELCGQLNPQEWRVRCHQLAFQGCALRAVSLNIQREGEPQDTPFTCRLGEFIVLDVASLQADRQAVGNVCIDDVIWLKSSNLCLNATLRWSYPAGRARYFRVHCRRLRGPDPRISPGPLELVGRCYSTLYRVTELQVAQPPALLELLVEPVTREGFSVPARHWGRRSLSYTE